MQRKPPKKSISKRLLTLDFDNIRRLRSQFSDRSSSDLASDLASDSSRLTSPSSPFSSRSDLSRDAPSDCEKLDEKKEEGEETEEEAVDETDEESVSCNNTAKTISLTIDEIEVRAELEVLENKKMEGLDNYYQERLKGFIDKFWPEQMENIYSNGAQGTREAFDDYIAKRHPFFMQPQNLELDFPHESYTEKDALRELRHEAAILEELKKDEKGSSEQRKWKPLEMALEELHKAKVKKELAEKLKKQSKLNKQSRLNKLTTLPKGTSTIVKGESESGLSKQNEAIAEYRRKLSQ